MMTIMQAIDCKAVPVSELCTGDTFLYHDTVGMMVRRNGHNFAMDLATGYSLNITLSDKVIPVNCSLTYKIK